MRSFKNYIPVVVFLLFVVLSLNITSAKVIEKESQVPILGAKVNFFYTNENGSISFLDTVFTGKITISRIGFKSQEIKPDFSLLFRNIGIVSLEKASIAELKEQVNNWAENVSAYSYELKSSSRYGSLNVEGKKKQDEFQFKFSNKDESGEDSYMVFNTNDGFFVKDSSGVLKGPLSQEEEDEFYESNIPFIELSDILNEVLTVNAGNSQFSKDGSFYISTANGFLEIFFDEQGNPCKFILNDRNNDNPVFTTLDIVTEGVKIKVDEN